MIMKFKGANGSLGLKTGAVYTVIWDPEYQKTDPKSKFKCMATIMGSNDVSVKCAYGSEKAFRANFEEVNLTPDELATVSFGEIKKA